MAHKNANKPLSRAERVRILLKEGRSVKEIAATVGVAAQFVYNVRYDAAKKAKAAQAAPDGVRISEKTGKPVRKYKKRRVKPASTPTPTPPKVQYIEIEVPQPHYNLTWGQRFKALFTGRV